MASRDDWQRRLGPLYGGAVALVHSTPWRWPVEVGADPRAAGWLVVLGVPVGGAAWLVAMLARAAGLPATIAALLGLAALSVGSAALIERGLAERVDHWDRRWHVPGLGARGPGVASLLVLVFATLVRAAAITSLAPSRWLAVFVATAVIGRWAAMFLQALGDPIAGEPVVDPVQVVAPVDLAPVDLAPVDLASAAPAPPAPVDRPRRSLVAAPAPAWLVAAISLAVAVLAVVAIGKAGILALALAALAAFGLGIEAQRRDGALSAPVVGTVAAIGELIVLMIAVI